MSLELSTTIESDPQTVFQFFRDPENLLKVHPETIGVNVTSVETKQGEDEVDYEIIRFTNLHVFPIAALSVASIGLKYSFDVTYTVWPEKLVIEHRFVMTTFVMTTLEARGNWTFESVENEPVTILVEKDEYTAPLVFSSFVVSQAKEVHEAMHQNAKRVIES